MVPEVTPGGPSPLTALERPEAPTEVKMRSVTPQIEEEAKAFEPFMLTLLEQRSYANIAAMFRLLADELEKLDQ